MANNNELLAKLAWQVNDLQRRVAALEAQYGSGHAGYRPREYKSTVDIDCRPSVSLAGIEPSETIER